VSRAAAGSKAVARFAITFRTARLRTGLLVGLIAGLAGCSVADSMSGEPGVDVSLVTPGATHATVESKLGSPVRSWVSEHGVGYSLYQFDIGVPPNAWTTAANVVMDIATAGFWEVAWETEEHLKQSDRKSGRVLVSFDEKGVVLGLFDEFDVLPADGRSDQRPEVFWY
jgi:hypothetical protein